MKRATLALLLVVAGASLTAAALPTMSAESVPGSRLATSFSEFAGSDANAQSLVSGLRTGSSITLTAADSSTTTFTPATGHMGWGNVKIALALARAELAKDGITNPTPADIQTALNGGTITQGTTTTTFAGVLTQRASGMGWGTIAHSDGLKVGAVVSGHSASHMAASQSAGAATRAGSGTGIVTAAGSMSANGVSHGKGTVVVMADGSSAAMGSGGAQSTKVTTINNGAATHGHAAGITAANGDASSHGAGHGHHGG